MSDLLDDMAIWLVVAIIAAGAMMTWIGPNDLAAWGSGPAAMLIMLVIGIPLYICASASTPLAAGLLLAGVSPGVVLVLLLAGPATNIGSIAILRKELGLPVLSTYLVGVALTSLAAGLAMDAIVGWWAIDIPAQIAEVGDIIPSWLAIASLAVLVVFSIRPLRRVILGAGRKPASACCAE